MIANISPESSPDRAAGSIMVDIDLLRKYDKSGPRYTSYPTVERFVEAYTARTHRTTLEQRSVTWGPAAKKNLQPLSLYVHIPFCRSSCHFCGCNKFITPVQGHAEKYLGYLEREFALVAAMLKGNRRVEQLHLGGGTPTFLSTDQLRTLMQAIGNHFTLSPGEYAVEIDPRTVDEEKIAALAQLGFNHMSFGVQDFATAVQQAVNRLQSEEETANAIAAARKHGVFSVGVDLIYGLPMQTLAGFDRTLDAVLAFKPDRIALYGYTHLPNRYKPQRCIDPDDLPAAELKLQIMLSAVRRLGASGYEYVGMDHFALDHDELAVATRHGNLHRSLQSHSTQQRSDLVGFGMSAVSKIGTTYSQNANSLDEYYDRLDRGELPVLRGIELTADDLLRRAVIHSLMRNFEVSIESIEIAHLIRFDQYFADELTKLETFERDGLVSLEPAWINVTPRGRLLVRSIAMLFDRHLTRGEQRERFSNVI
jgi:oxygen-independent coproporphyrinogen III oxidase